MYSRTSKNPVAYQSCTLGIPKGSLEIVSTIVFKNWFGHEGAAELESAPGSEGRFYSNVALNCITFSSMFFIFVASSWLGRVTSTLLIWKSLLLRLLWRSYCAEEEGIWWAVGLTLEFETESLINRMRLVGLVRGLLRGTVSEEAGCTGGLVIEEKLQVFIEELWRVNFLRPSGWRWRQ